MKVIKSISPYIIASIFFVSLISFSNQIDTSSLTGALNSAVNSTLTQAVDLLNSTASGLFNTTGLDNFTIPDLNIRDIINAVPLVPVSSLTDLSTSFILKTALDGAFSKLYLEFGAYYMNKCTDNRVESLFGSLSDPMDASFACQDLVYDWAQVYGPYVNNNWFCNLQGTSSSKADDMGFIIPSCSCNPGYAGQNCMFNQTTYDNADAWINTLKKWLDNYLSTKTINRTIIQSDVVSDLLDITENILVFSSNANVNDLVFI